MVVEEKMGVDKCMEPMFASSFPIGDEAFTTLATMTPMDKGQPPTIWEMISEFPTSDEGMFDVFFSSDKDSEQKLWFIVKEETDAKVWTYDVTNSSWIPGPIVSKNAKLFSDSIGNVWLIEPLHEKPSSLYKIDPDTMSIGSEGEKNQIFTEHTILHFASTPNGMIWLILAEAGYENQLYLFNPSTSELIKYFDPENYLSLETDDNGFVYLLLSDGVIQLYNPDNEELKEIWVNDSNGPLRLINNGLFATANNELWVSDVSKFRIADERLTTQHVIVRSPVFITNIFNGYSPFIWDRPEPQADTKDGRIWFRSERGLAWHQPETGEWCMFTSAQSNIVKDSQENLWIVYDNALYMLPASETSKKE